MKFLKYYLICAITQFVFAEQSPYKVTSSTLNASIKPYTNFYSTQGDGLVWGVMFPVNKETSIFKISKTGTTINLGNIPHPNIKEIPATTILIAVNSMGIALISYRFVDEENKPQNVFYVLKQNKWIKLANFEGDAYFVNKIFIDDNENVYFKTLGNKHYVFKNNSWGLMNNPVNDPLSVFEHEKTNTFEIMNDVVYTAKRLNSEDGYNLVLFKYNKDKVNYSSSIAIGNKYKLACATALSDNKVLIALAQNQNNLSDQILKFDIVNLSNSTDYPYTFTSSTTSDNQQQEEDQIIKIADVNITQYLSDTYEIDFENENRMTCRTVGDTGYFILKNAAFNSLKPTYTYFKVSK